MSSGPLRVFKPELEEEGLPAPEGMEADVTDGDSIPSFPMTPLFAGMNDAEIQEHLDEASRKGSWMVVIYTASHGDIHCWSKRHHEFPVSSYPACIRLLVGQLRDAATRVYDKTVAVMEHLLQLTSE